MFKQVVFGMAAGALISAVHGETEGTDQGRIAELERQVQVLSDAFQLQQEMSVAETMDLRSGFRFGGYGDIHANFEENGKSVFDIHRLVMYVGYDFSDWITLNSEIELEHAYVTDGAGGEISIEQLYADFQLADSFNVRAGRMLAPMGIINHAHEPTLFFGVERPSVDKYIIPSTWSIDGVGVFGAPFGWLNYQAYVVGGLNGSAFSASDGVRGGRIKERGGLNAPAITGRIDLFPFDEQDLRLGVSAYYGGTDNANKGGGSGAENNFGMYSADFEYTVSRLQVRGVVALGDQSDPENLPVGVGEQIFGWYLEAGVSVMPESWMSGKLVEADILPFVRYEEFDTQHKVLDGTVKDGANDRTDITVGVNLPLTQQLILKADYQFKYSKAAADPNNTFNLGMGWAF
ncbi:porin [Pontiella sp.]|uniref:porin n=1 Tax=Pontiella sp. TaxID=2837462 RepID=UPI003564EF1A